MGNLWYPPSVAVSVTASLLGDKPATLPYVLYAESSETLAPAIGNATIAIWDPTHKWADAIRPDDLISINYSSPNRPASATGAPSWSGLVDECFTVADPASGDGTVTMLYASTWWKAFAATSVPLQYFLLGNYPITMPLGQILTNAVADVAADKHLTVQTQVDTGALNITTQPLTVPNDFLNPAYQNYASWLLTQVIPYGLEAFFDEAGVFHLRTLQAMRDVADAVIPGERIYRRQHGVSDKGLITNVVVAYTPTPLSSNAMESPANGVEGRTPGPLPSVLLGKDGQPLPRLGQRFQSLAVSWLPDAADAGYYAAMARLVGLSAVDQAELDVVLDGDRRLGDVVSVPDAGKRWYVTAITHRCAPSTGLADTHLSGRYGIGIGQAWDRSQVNNYGRLALPDYPGNAYSPTALPALGADPSAQLVAPTMTKDDIGAALAARGSPFADQAAYIWTESQQYQVDPAFALAVWTIETQLGTDGSPGSLAFNPGNLGPGNAYPTWQAGIDAWYKAVTTVWVGAGKTTVGQIAPTYAPDDPTWAAKVGGQMAHLRGNRPAGVTGTEAPSQTVVAGSQRDTILKAAATQKDVPYLLADGIPGVHWDCSSFAQWCYQQAGIALPRTAQEQYNATTRLAPAQLVPGDLVFFQHTYDTPDTVTHVGIYTGGGQMVDAQSAGVSYDAVFGGWAGQYYYGAGRPPALT